MEALSKLGEIARLWGDIKERGTVGQRAQRGFCPWGVKASQRAVEPGDLARDNGGAYRTSGRAAGGGEGGGVGVGPALGGGAHCWEVRPKGRENKPSWAAASRQGHREIRGACCGGWPSPAVGEKDGKRHQKTQRTEINTNQLQFTPQGKPIPAFVVYHD